MRQRQFVRRRPFSLRPIFHAEAVEPRRLLSAIASDQTVTGNIATATQVDSYTFNVAAGQSVYAAAADTDPAGALTVVLTLVGPNGNTVKQAASATGTSILATNLTDAGTYTLKVTGQFGSVGSYTATLALPGVAPVGGTDAGPIASGAYHTAAITAGDLDVYTISGTAGGSLLAAIGDLDPKSPFTPDIIVFSPTGGFMKAAADPTGTNILLTNLPATGKYYVVASDQFSNNTGTYGITVATFGGTQVTDADSGPIDSGSYRTGTIDPGDFDVYTISATSGGSLLASIGDLSPAASFIPEVIIFSPSGAFQRAAADPNGTQILLKNLPESGTYYVVAIDQFSNDTGGYGLSVARFGGSQTVSTGDEGGPLANGTYRTGAILPGDFDTYTINGSVGQTVVAAIGDLDTTSPFIPDLLLISPTGDVLENVAGAQGTSFVYKSLPATGTYAVVAIDQFGNDTGRYGMTVDVVGGAATPIFSPGDEGGPLNSAQRTTGKIAPGDIDAYTFTLGAGSGGFWTVGETVESNTFSPRLIIVDPNGGVPFNTTGALGAEAKLPQIGAVAAGTYTALVLDSSGGDAGEYALTGVFVPAVQNPDDSDNGTLAPNQPRAGSLPPGDADVYTVTATAGQKLTFNLAQTGTGSLSPRLIVYRPDGFTAGDNSSGPAQVVVNNAVAGTYTVVVADASGNGSGAYSVAFNGNTGTDSYPPQLLESAYRFNDAKPSVRLAFSEDVSASFQPDSFTLKNLTTGQTIDPANLSITFTHYANEIYLGTAPLPGGVLPDGNYRLTIPAAKLTDVAGNPLTQDVSLDFFVLAGDANRDRKVGFGDLLTLAQNYNGTGRSFSEGDFNYDGKINFSDLLILAQHYNETVPPPVVATAPDLLHAAAKKTRNLASPLLH